jgi:amidase
MSKDWQSLAKEKRESILAAIPPEWRIDNPPNDQQVDVTGAYIQQYLKPREVEITETPAEDILKRTTTGQWSAEEVTRAFCHRAALAHQLVCKFHLSSY